MLQFTITRSPLLSEKEQAQMVIDAGCQWIELDTEGHSDEEIENLAGEIIPLCKEAGVILVFSRHHLLVDKLRVHGVRLTAADISPVELREKLGGHVIIGVELSKSTDLAMLKRADADYIQIPDATTTSVSELSARMDAEGIVFPIVAAGRYDFDMMAELREAGASGFNIDIRSLVGPEYALSLKSLISSCETLR